MLALSFFQSYLSIGSAWTTSLSIAGRDKGIENRLTSAE
jgi:hypothetical protein